MVLTQYKLIDLYKMDSGLSSKPEQAGHGSPFISFSTIFNNPILPNEIVDKMDTTIEEQIKYSVKKSDVLITRTSETLDELAMSSVALKDYPTVTFSGFAKRLRPTRENIENKITYDKYMAFFFRSEYFRKIVNNMATMTLRASFNEQILSYINIHLPNYQYQVKIGDMLHDIYKQIQRNNMMVKKLQVLTQSIYSYWFNQFEFPNKEGKPYKSSGGNMIYNEELKREIPEGWEIKKLKDLVFKVVRDYNYDTEEKTIDLSVMPSNSFYLNEINSSKNFTTNLFSMKQGDILFGAIRPYLKKAGIAPCDGAVTGTVHCLNVHNELDYNFCLLTLCSENMFSYASKTAKGTKMPVISCDDLLNYPIAYNKDIISKFNDINIKDIVSSLAMESQKLSALKKFLLPLLINQQLE